MIMISGKKAAALLTAAFVGIMPAAAFAHSEMDNMIFAGYDTTNPDAPNKIYNEMIAGRYTSKQILVPIEPQWCFAGYEKAFPHAGYDVMCLEGVEQKKIVRYNNLFPQWDARRNDYEWEIKRPHYVWERQQTKINNQDWQWDFGFEDYRGNPVFKVPDSDLKTLTARQALNPSYEKKNYGFGYLNNSGEVLSPLEQEMYGAFNVGSAITQWKSLVDNSFTPARLSARDENNRYIMTDEEIASVIPVVRSEYITAQLNSGSKKTTKSVAAEYLAHSSSWQWDYDLSFDIVYNATVSWSMPYYESAEPYNQYQFLIVNGVTLDGSLGRDRIFRYTGGIAAPVVEWRFVFFQPMADNNEIYEVVEQKYIDGKAALDENNSFVYRIPVGEFGKTYFVETPTSIQYWVRDEKGHSALLKEFDKYVGNLGGNIDSYSTAPYNVDISISQNP